MNRHKHLTWRLYIKLATESIHCYFVIRSAEQGKLLLKLH